MLKTLLTLIKILYPYLLPLLLLRHRLTRSVITSSLCHTFLHRMVKYPRLQHIKIMPYIIVHLCHLNALHLKLTLYCLRKRLLQPHSLLLRICKLWTKIKLFKHCVRFLIFIWLILRLCHLLIVWTCLRLECKWWL